MLHGGGPGASAWSNFGRNLPVFAECHRASDARPAGVRRVGGPPVEGNYFTFAARALASLLDTCRSRRFTWSATHSAAAPRSGSRWTTRSGRAGWCLMGPGGLSLNVFSPDPTEGVGRLAHSRRRPGRARRRWRRSCARWCSTQKLITDELIEERYAPASTPEALAAMASLGMSFFDPATAEDGMLWREVHRLRNEVLLIWGREDRVNPLDGALVPLKQIRKAQLHVFSGCGHWAQLEKFDQFNRLVLDFLGQGRKAAQ